MKFRLLVILSIMVCAAANAQERFVPQTLQYAAKFVCGEPLPKTANANVAASGRYFTAINVHNPSSWQTANFVKKFAVGLPEERVGTISPFFKAVLKPDETMQIDCGNIWRHLNMALNTFVEGYAVLQTPLELDVVSVYTAANGPAFQVSSIETERVPFRVMVPPPPCPPVDLATGPAWSIVIDPSGGAVPRPAVDMVPNHPWAIPGMQFISYAATGNSSGFKPPTVWTYERCFCACPGVTPQLNIVKFFADDEAEVFLNQHSLGPVVIATTATPAQISAINAAAAPFWLPGRNCLQVKVTDTANSLTGFGLIGSASGMTECVPPPATNPTPNTN